MTMRHANFDVTLNFEVDYDDEKETADEAAERRFNEDPTGYDDYEIDVWDDGTEEEE